jgi:enolase
MKSIEKAGFKPGEDVVLALDCAATEFFKGQVRDGGRGQVAHPAHGRISGRSRARLPDHLDRGRHVRGRLGGLEASDRPDRQQVQLVGDDLFVTNPSACAMGIEKGLANSILVKVNQIGSLTETLEAVDGASRAATPP